MCCSVLQCVAVCCCMFTLTIRELSKAMSKRRVLQYVAVCCSLLHCVTVYCSMVQCVAVCYCIVVQCGVVWCSVLQYAEVCCSVLPCVAVCCSVWQCVALCCSVLQCVAVCCSALWTCFPKPSVLGHGRRRLDLKQLRLPKFPTNFHGSPRTYQTRFQWNPQIFTRDFTCVNGVFVAPKIFRENR